MLKKQFYGRGQEKLQLNVRCASAMRIWQNLSRWYLNTHLLGGCEFELKLDSINLCKKFNTLFLGVSSVPTVIDFDPPKWGFSNFTVHLNSTAGRSC